jgi:hypothetical protein
MASTHWTASWKKCLRELFWEDYASFCDEGWPPRMAKRRAAAFIRKVARY